MTSTVKSFKTHPPETNFGTVTSFLPLSTAFPYKAGCSSSMWARLSIADIVVAFDPGYGITVDSAAVCMPPQATSWWETEWQKVSQLGHTMTVYSIAPIVCPEAYTTVGTSMVGVGGVSTLVACCPSGYSFSSLLSAGIVGQCLTTLPSGAVMTYAQLKNGSEPSGGVQIRTTTFTSPQRVVAIPVNGYNFGSDAITSSGDFATFSSITSSPTQSTTIISPSSTPVTSSSNNLWVGAKAGIGVAVSVVGIAILVGIYVFYRKRKGAGLLPNTVQWRKSSKGPVESDSRQIHELDEGERMSVVKMNMRPQELGS
ncbi:hypothetical protein BGZ60DRAFT_531141 [Tricladium varicosporioides]|nr:hypothetical protein BGZ60DRAFT_531141 [Hymenoscyphus varicosporioides]